MTKKEVKKNARPLLYRDKMSHQEIYEGFKTPKPTFNKIIATELGKLPSIRIIEKFKTYRYAYVILVALLLVARGLGVLVLFQTRISSSWKLLMFAFVIALPIYAIIVMLGNRMDQVRSVSILLIISVFRGVTEVKIHPEDLVWLIPMGVIIFLGFWLPVKMKTPYSTEMKTVAINGKKQVDFEIKFNDAGLSEDEDLIDV